jgi:outer membrane protein assembly factor BamB
MRKNLIFIILLSLTFSLFSLVKNVDKPLKGNWDFKPEKVWSIDQAGNDLLTRVARIQVDSNGNVYVMEVKQGKIYVFDKKGKYLYSIGKRGEGPGEYKMAYNFFVCGDFVIVPEMRRIHFFKKDGKFIKTYIEKSSMFPRGFIDENRMIYVKSDREGMGKVPEKVNVFNFKTEQNRTLLTVPPEEAITAQKGGMRIVIKDSQTTPGIVLSIAKNEILIGKSDKYKIKKIDLNGKELMEFALDGRTRKHISEEFKRKRFESISLNGGKMPKDMIDLMTKNMPDISTFFSRIITDHFGKIYVFISDLENKSGQEIDIFSPNGKYLYHSNINIENCSIKSGIVFKKGFLYLFGEDDDGEGSLMKFRIKFPK